MKFRIKPVILFVAALALAGCESTIKQYDSTFTSKLNARGMNHNFSSLSSRGLKFRVDKDNRLKEPKPYFIEFRARNALTYGHVAVVFGKLNSKGGLPVDKNGVLDPKMVQISGLHPATPSSVPWSVGHVVPVPAETGPSDGDFEEKYVTARYRIKLTKSEFNRVVRIINKHKRQNKLWYAPAFMANCLGYLTSIAKDIGLKAPTFAKMPKEYIRELKRLNSRPSSSVKSS